MRTDGRVRRSRGSVERHTAQSHPIAGTPCDVPLPSTVTLRLNNALSIARGLRGPRRFNKAQAQLVENLFEDLTLLSREVPSGLLIEEREDLDHLGGALEVDLGPLARDRVGHVAEMNRGRARQRQHESDESQRRFFGLIRHVSWVIG
jgi:hypothetical protein